MKHIILLFLTATFCAKAVVFDFLVIDDFTVAPFTQSGPGDGVVTGSSEHIVGGQRSFNIHDNGTPDTSFMTSNGNGTLTLFSEDGGIWASYGNYHVLSYGSQQNQLALDLRSGEITLEVLQLSAPLTVQILLRDRDRSILPPYVYADYVISQPGDIRAEIDDFTIVTVA